MSAIAGIFRTDHGPVGRGSIEAVLTAMASGAPDGRSYWHSGPVAFGHGLLRSTGDEVTQPRASISGTLVIVMDGRLDEKETLARSLRAHGIHVTATASDADLVLHAYEVWGEDCPRQLLGDFAFAIWDEQRQHLFCAVDAMGACQIYYAETPGLFAFASSDEALLSIAEVSNAPDESTIALEFAPQVADLEASRSWIRSVKVLIPGQQVTVGRDGCMHLRQHWQWRSMDELSFGSYAEVVEAFGQIFGDAVRCRLRSASPVALMLSGGIDSSCILDMATRSGATLDTYSGISDDDPDCVESICIRTLTGGRSAHYLSVPSMGGTATLDELLTEAWSNAHPVDNSLLLPALLARAAGRNGSRVVLNGAAGDVTLNVPDRYPAVFMRQGAWGRAVAECMGAAKHNFYVGGGSPLKLIAANAWTAFTPLPLKQLVFEARRVPSSLPLQLLNPDFVRRHSLREKLAAARRQRSLPSSMQEDQIAAINHPFGPFLGFKGFSRIARRHGVEMRDPWADRRVVEFFIRLPLCWKVRDGWTKYVPRSAMQTVDSQIRWRTGKEHIGWKVIRRVMDESRDFVEHLVGTRLQAAGAYVDAEAAHQALARVLGAPPKPTSPALVRDQQHVYEVAVLIQWLQRLENRSANR